MAIGGETIGRAYVRILADGSGLSDDIRRQMQANDRDFQQGGEQNSRAYRRGFNREIRKQGVMPQRDLDNAIREGAGRWDAGGHILGSAMLDGVRNELEQRFPNDVGTTIFRNLKDQLERGEIDFTGLKRSLRDLRPEVAKATDQIVGHQKERFEELGRAVEDYGGTLVKTRNERRHLLTELQTLGAQLPRNVTDTDQFRRRMEELGNILTPTGNRLQRMRDRFAQTGETIGKAFGRGSRNDFLNFFGGFVSLAPRMIGGLTGITRGVAGLIGQFREAFRAGETFREGIGNVVSGIGSLASAGLPGLIAAAIAVGAAIQTIGVVLPLFGAAISLVLGLVLSLAGSLGFALVGGLVAVGGALVPFAAAIGVAALAMSALSKKAKIKEFQDSVKGLKKEFTNLKKVAVEGIFGKDAGGLSNLTPVLKGIEPIVKTVSKALGGLLTQFGDFAKTKGFTTLMGDLSKLLGPMVTQLGQIGGNLAVGLLQVFRDGAPLIQDFLGWLGQVAQGFADAGKGGKDSPLATFLKGAGDSAKIIGPLILDIVDAIGILFAAGKGTGDSLFAEMAVQAEKLVTWLSSKEGQKALKTWFEDAKRLGDKLGDIVQSAIDLVDALDTEKSRAGLMRLLDAVNWIIGAITWSITKIDEFNTAIGNFIGAIPGFFASIPGFFVGLWATVTSGFSAFIGTGLQHWGELVAGIQAFFTPIGAFFVGIWNGITSTITSFVTTGLEIFAGLPREIGAAFTNLPATISAFVSTGLQIFAALPREIMAAFAALPANIAIFVQQLIQPFVDLYNYLIGNSLIPDLVNGIVAWFARLPGLIAGALGDIAGRFVIWLAGVPQKIQSAVGLVAGAFSGLAQKAISRAGNIVAAFGKWVASLPGKAKTVATSVAAGFGNLAGKMISKAGSLAARFASWVSSIAGKAKSAATGAISAFSGMAGKMIARAGSLAAKFASWLASVPGKAKAAATKIVAAFAGLAGKIVTRAGDISSKIAAWGAKAVSSAGRVASNIVSKFSGLATKIVNAIGNIVPKIKMPSIPRPIVNAIVKVKGKAAGGIVNGAQIAMIGEAGPEAIVPLNRALSRVDPAVRALSAFAQGMTPPGSANTGPSIGRQIDVGGITINTPTTDPRAVASEVVNRLTFSAYI